MIKEIVSMIKTETKEVIITETSKMITKEAMKVGKWEREVALLAKEPKMVIIKRNNTTTRKDLSMSTRRNLLKSTRRNLLDKFSMIQTTKRKKKEKTEKEIRIKEKEAVEDNKWNTRLRIQEEIEKKKDKAIIKKEEEVVITTDHKDKEVEKISTIISKTMEISSNTKKRRHITKIKQKTSLKNNLRLFQKLKVN